MVVCTFTLDLEIRLMQLSLNWGLDKLTLNNLHENELFEFRESMEQDIQIQAPCTQQDTNLQLFVQICLNRSSGWDWVPFESNGVRHIPERCPALVPEPISIAVMS